MALTPLVVIGASSGGPATVERLLRQIEPPVPWAAVVVQHMPPAFTRTLAERLDRTTPLAVREALPGDGLQPGQVLVAPGGAHLLFDGRRRVRLAHDPPVNFVRPAVDVTLEAAAAPWGDRLVAVILTGMGKDGTSGCLAVKRHGGQVWVQDPAEAVMPSMPEHVVASGVADRILPVDRLAQGLSDLAW